NLVFALAASLGIVLFLVLVVVRPSMNPAPNVDYQKLAADAQPTVSEPLASPSLPKSWSANAARLKTGSDGIVTRYIGLIQGIKANPSWVAAQLESARATGKHTIGGIDWTVYDQRDSGKTDTYALAATVHGSSYVLQGSADVAEFRTLASALAAELAQAPKNQAPKTQTPEK